MDELKRIKRYIEGVNPSCFENYTMRCDEIKAISNLAMVAPVDAIILAFQFGQVKGYRAAMKEAKE